MKRRHLIPWLTGTALALTACAATEPPSLTVNPESTPTSSISTPPVVVAPTTTTTVPAPTTTTTVPPSPVQPANSQPITTTTVPAFGVPSASTIESNAPTWTCATGTAYIELHGAPGFTVECPFALASGEAAFTCINVLIDCQGEKVVRVADPSCANAWLNEAANTWTLQGEPVPMLGDAMQPIDPYGEC